MHTEIKQKQIRFVSTKESLDTLWLHLYDNSLNCWHFWTAPLIIEGDRCWLDGRSTVIRMLYWLQTFQAQGSFLLLEILEDMFIYGLPQTMPLLICTLFQQRYGLRSKTSSILHYGDVAEILNSIGKLLPTQCRCQWVSVLEIKDILGKPRIVFTLFLHLNFHSTLQASPWMHTLLEFLAFKGL